MVADILKHVKFTFIRQYLRPVPSLRQQKDLDVEPYWWANHGSTITLSYPDPDRHKVNCFDTPEEATEYGKSARHRLHNQDNRNSLRNIDETLPSIWLREYSVCKPVMLIL